MSKYKAILQEIQDTIYGQNVELTNWHLNGDTEPFDSFADRQGWFDDLDSQDDQPTLRDEFAMVALPSFINTRVTVEQATRQAYIYADAMLKERSKCKK